MVKVSDLLIELSSKNILQNGKTMITFFSLKKGETVIKVEIEHIKMPLMGIFILVSNIIITSLQMSHIVNQSQLSKDMYTN